MCPYDCILGRLGSVAWAAKELKVREMIGPSTANGFDVVDLHVGVNSPAAFTSLASKDGLDIGGRKLAGRELAGSPVHVAGPLDNLQSFGIIPGPAFEGFSIALRIILAPSFGALFGALSKLRVLVAFLVSLFVGLPAGRRAISIPLSQSLSVCLTVFAAVLGQAFAVFLLIPTLICAVSVRVLLCPCFRAITGLLGVVGVLSQGSVFRRRIFPSTFGAGSVYGSARGNVSLRARLARKISIEAKPFGFLSRDQFHKVSVARGARPLNNFVVA